MKPKGKRVFEPWTAEQDKQLVQIVEQTYREKKPLTNAWIRGCKEIARKHEHNGKDPNRPCLACEDRWTRVLKKRIGPEKIEEWKPKPLGEPLGESLGKPLGETLGETLQETPQGKKPSHSQRRSESLNTQGTKRSKRSVPNRQRPRKKKSKSSGSKSFKASQGVSSGQQSPPVVNLVPSHISGQNFSFGSQRTQGQAQASRSSQDKTVTVYMSPEEYEIWEAFKGLAERSCRASREDECAPCTWHEGYGVASAAAGVERRSVAILGHVYAPCVPLVPQNVVPHRRNTRD
jgi:hypothetical protein